MNVNDIERDLIKEVINIALMKAGDSLAFFTGEKVMMQSLNYAVEKIYELKKRADTKAMIVLVPEEKWILDYVAEPAPKVADYIKGITKPTTVIYDQAKNVASNLIAADGSIAIRICKANFAQQLMQAFGKPIVSTSANISGLPTPKCFKDISLDIIEGVDYVVRSEQEDTSLKAPSAIVKWDKDQIIIIRP